MADDKVKSLLDRFDDARESAARKAAGAAAKRTIGKLADGLLDEIEQLLLGEKGAAEEILKKERGVDPLERIRDAYRLEEGEVEREAEGGSGEVKVNPAEEKRAKALAELLRLKAVRTGMEPDEAPVMAVDPEPDDEPTARPAKARRRL